MSTWAPTLTWCALVVVFAAMSNVWNGHEPGWYASLARPSFQPPDIVFGLMWPLNFLLVLVVGATTVRTAPPGAAWTATGVLAVSVALALGWAYLFYVPHSLVGAAACLAAAAVLTWVLLAWSPGSRCGVLSRWRRTPSDSRWRPRCRWPTPG